MIASNACFNIPSVDTFHRGQWSEVKRTENRPPFEDWWNGGLDVLLHWNQIVAQKTSKESSGDS